jgi:hypothetical protein
MSRVPARTGIQSSLAAAQGESRLDLYCGKRSIQSDLVGVSQLRFFTISSYWYIVNVHKIPETHTKRQATQHGCLHTSPLAGQRGQIKWNSVRWGKKIFWTKPTRAAKARQKSLVPARQPKDPFQIHTPGVPIHLSLNSQHGPPFSSLSAKYCHWQRSLF